MEWPAVISAFKANALPDQGASDQLVHQRFRAKPPAGRGMLEYYELRYQELKRTSR